MKFTVYKSSDIFNRHTLEINTLEDLRYLYEKENYTELIINFKEKWIEIYDTWREENGY